MNTKQIVAASVGVFLLFGAARPMQAQGPMFSIDPASPSAAFVSPADILTPGPVGGPPTVLYSRAALGLLPGDAITSLATFPPSSPSKLIPYFTVDRGTIGIPIGAPDVFSEGAAGQSAGDIFRDPTGGTIPPFNQLAINQHALGLLPNILPGVAFGGALDHLSALDLRIEPDLNLDGVPDLPVFITLAPGSPTLAAMGLTAADVLFAGGVALGAPPMLAIPAAGLGLGPGDVIDGFDIDGGPLFSLAPGSPSLGLNSPADILAAPGLAVFGPSVGTLGVLPGDNLTDFAFVPEPGAGAALMGMGLLGFALLRRQRPKD